jgi:hypothetical protein
MRVTRKKGGCKKNQQPRDPTASSHQKFIFLIVFLHSTQTCQMPSFCMRRSPIFHTYLAE